jgi:hypothetical protein
MCDEKNLLIELYDCLEKDFVRGDFFKGLRLGGVRPRADEELIGPASRAGVDRYLNSRRITGMVIPPTAVASHHCHMESKLSAHFYGPPRDHPLESGN